VLRQTVACVPIGYKNEGDTLSLQNHKGMLHLVQKDGGGYRMTSSAAGGAAGEVLNSCPAQQTVLSRSAPPLPWRILHLDAAWQGQSGPALSLQGHQGYQERDVLEIGWQRRNRHAAVQHSGTEGGGQQEGQQCQVQFDAAYKEVGAWFEPPRPEMRPHSTEERREEKERMHRQMVRE